MFLVEIFLLFTGYFGLKRGQVQVKHISYPKFLKSFPYSYSFVQPEIV